MRKRIFLLAGSVTCIIGLIFFNQSNPVVIDRIKNAKNINESLYIQPNLQSSSSIKQAKTLHGLEFPYSPELDEHNTLIIDLAMRQLFDFYLSGLGETNLEHTISRIQLALSQTLSPANLNTALNILKRYIDYKIALQEHAHQLAIDTLNMDTSQLVDAQHVLQNIRNEFFTVLEQQAFFSLEDAHSHFLMTQLSITHNDTLSDSEKQQQLAQAEAQLPEHIALSRQQAQGHAHLREHVQTLKNSGASEEQIFQIRAQQLGSEAAQALAQLDKERNVWKSRLEEFSQKREQVLNSSLSQQDQLDSIAALIQAEFSETEQKRVQALIKDGQI